MARLYLSPPEPGVDDSGFIDDALASNWIAPLGPHVDAFEDELGVATASPHVAALSSGTAALHLALLLLGVGAGDDVLVADLTFVASANAVRYVGARPCFIDSDPRTWTLDPAILQDELNQRAKRGDLPAAVIAVDLYGQPADYATIAAACREHGVPLIQDAAEGLGARHRDAPCGSQGDLGILSFNGNKIITTSGGGALLATNEAQVAGHVRWPTRRAWTHLITNMKRSDSTIA